jgi:hypothetical protein
VWIPRSEQAILAAIEAGGLTETATFDAKAALPAKGKSKDLAIDVAAMANDGGTLLYGVDEDEQGRPTDPKPFDLAGAKERVDQIVRTSISEPPAIEVHEVRVDDDPGLGYLVVAVPPSPRAPHMVTVGAEHRYYGRGATGNVRLTEGEVARLYERRRRWEVDRDTLLKEAISRAPIEPREDFGYLHLVARPVVTDEGMFDRARGETHPGQFLNSLISTALRPEIFKPKVMSELYPDLPAISEFRPTPRGWITRHGLEEEWMKIEGPRRALVFEIGLDGSGYLFCGSVAEEHRGRLLIHEDQVAGLTVRFLSVLGGSYDAAGYLGPVDVGVAVTGMRGGVSAALQDHRFLRHSLEPYDGDRYLRTDRSMASLLRDDPQAAARNLILPLTRVITMESYDPLSESSS